MFNVSITNLSWADLAPDFEFAATVFPSSI